MPASPGESGWKRKVTLSLGLHCFVLASHTIPPRPPKHLNSEFWSFSLESLPFRHLSRLRLQICVPGVTKLVFAERQICTLKHLLGALCPPRIPPGLPIHERKVTERWSSTQRKPFPGSTFPRQWKSSLSSVHYWT